MRLKYLARARHPRALPLGAIRDMKTCLKFTSRHLCLRDKYFMFHETIFMLTRSRTGDSYTLVLTIVYYLFEKQCIGQEDLFTMVWRACVCACADIITHIYIFDFHFAYFCTCWCVCVNTYMCDCENIHACIRSHKHKHNITRI